MEEKRSKKKKEEEEGTSLPDDLVVEILSRLPARSAHRFKCVSRSWCNLISHPDHRKKLPQTLAGFFYGTYHCDRRPRTARHFAAISDAGPQPPVDPSLTFLPKKSDVDQLDTCNGLVLCRCYKTSSVNEFDYIVCNPSTGRWVDLPPRPTPNEACTVCTARLAFNPAVSSHFHVLEFEDMGISITGVNIYSSQTGGWNHRENGWDENTILGIGFRSVFMNGMLHLIAGKPVLVAVVDMEGEAWRTIQVPHSFYERCFIGLSQGCLHYVNTIPASQIVSIWFLKDYDSDEWVLKHSVSTEELLSTGRTYWVTAIHPDCDVIFFVSWDTTSLVSYDMRRGEFRFICNLEEGSTGLFLPYVPLYSESIADGH